MNLNLLKTISSVLGGILFIKGIFWIFNPSEILTVVGIYILTIGLYGIQNVKWEKNSSTTFFGFTIYKSRIINQQLCLFGIIPISKVQTLENHVAYFPSEEITPLILENLKSSLLSSLPLGGVISSVSSSRKSIKI